MEFRYDGGRENISRIPKLIMAALGGVLSLVAGYCLVNGIRIFPGRAAFVMVAMLLAGPVLLAIYLANLSRHYQYRSTRLVLEDDALILYTGASQRRIERKDIDYVHHNGSMLEIRLRNQDPILLPAQFTDQDELLRRLG